MSTCSGEERGEAFFIQHKHCVFPVCKTLGCCTESGPGPFLSPLLNHVTASAVRMYISVKLFPIIVGSRLIFFFKVCVVGPDHTL